MTALALDMAAEQHHQQVLQSDYEQPYLFPRNSTQTRPRKGSRTPPRFPSSSTHHPTGDRYTHHTSSQSDSDENTMGSEGMASTMYDRLHTSLQKDAQEFNPDAMSFQAWSQQTRRLRDLSPDLLALEADLQQQHLQRQSFRQRRKSTKRRTDGTPIGRTNSGTTIVFHDEYEYTSSSDEEDRRTAVEEIDSDLHHQHHISATPSLTESSLTSSPSSRSASIDSFNSYLPTLYSDRTPAPSPIDSLTSSPVVGRSFGVPWGEESPEAALARLSLTEQTRNDSSSTLRASSQSEIDSEALVHTATTDEEEPRILSLPLKICAFALALLPIPTSVLTAIGQSGGSGSNPPPLPVEHPTDPPTCTSLHILA